MAERDRHYSGDPYQVPVQFRTNAARKTEEQLRTRQQTTRQQSSDDDDENDDAWAMPKPHSSAVKYTNSYPRKSALLDKKNPKKTKRMRERQLDRYTLTIIVSLIIIVMVGGWWLLTTVSTWWINWQDDLHYEEMDRRMQSHEAYKALPTKVSQQVLILLHKNWLSFFEALKAYKEDPSTFTGRPRLPKYKHKTEGRNILIYTLQALQGGQSKQGIQGIIKPAGLAITIKTQQQAIKQVRIIPRNGYYVVEVVYSKAPVPAQVDPSFCVAIDLGVTNLAAITSNREGFVPRLVNGRTLKAINQWYNKRMKELTLCLPKAERERVTKQMEQITNNRNRQVNHYLHAASKTIIDFLVEQGVGTIIVGKNLLWKQEVNHGRRNNQNFVSIPHARFIDMLTYKAELVGIQVELQEESYTSKASFLDLDPIPTYQPDDDTEYRFSGKRIGRRNRLYRTKDGRLICADVNGSYNILRKRKPDVFAKAAAKGLAAYVVQPLRLAITV